MIRLETIAQLDDRFEAYIIDLWGVLHDGTTAYPGALAALHHLKDEGKKVVLLSNAPRRAYKAEEVLENLGFTDDLYDTLLTSGEVAFRHFNVNSDLGGSYFYIGPDKDRHLLEEADHLKPVDTAEEADFAVMTGFEGVHSTFEEKQPQLDAALAQNIPLICPNPDLKVVKQTGETWLCAGLAAHYYEENKGTVHYFGKPYPAVYDACFEVFGMIPRSHVCAIGDSLYTDILGANEQHIFSVLVAGGIHAADLGVIEGALPDKTLLDEVIESEGGISPNAVIGKFC